MDEIITTRALITPLHFRRLNKHGSAHGGGHWTPHTGLIVKGSDIRAESFLFQAAVRFNLTGSYFELFTRLHFAPSMWKHASILKIPSISPTESLNNTDTKLQTSHKELTCRIQPVLQHRNRKHSAKGSFLNVQVNGGEFWGVTFIWEVIAVVLLSQFPDALQPHGSSRHVDSCRDLLHNQSHSCHNSNPIHFHWWQRGEPHLHGSFLADGPSWAGWRTHCEAWRSFTCSYWTLPGWVRVFGLRVSVLSVYGAEKGHWPRWANISPSTCFRHVTLCHVEHRGDSRLILMRGLNPVQLVAGGLLCWLAFRLINCIIQTRVVQSGWMVEELDPETSQGLGGFKQRAKALVPLKTSGLLTGFNTFTSVWQKKSPNPNRWLRTNTQQFEK